MTEEENEHNHMITAVFCGWEARKPIKEYLNGYLELEEEEVGCHVVSNDDILEELPYGTDWNYLLPAYNVYREKVKEEVDYDEVTIRKLMITLDDLTTAILYVDIDKAFKKLVTGIELYNTIKIAEV